jgi:hypothetical protein
VQKTKESPNIRTSNVVSCACGNHKKITTTHYPNMFEEPEHVNMKNDDDWGKKKTSMPKKK